ncbi:hypothetical protein J7J12_00590 [bacterium]|nr:hypothetical protein [bacterium]
MDKFLQTQIKKMETEIFPLDRILPLGTVFKIFKDEYEKSDNKKLFFSDRKYQRLREGYFALFVAAALNYWEKKDHFLHFPKNSQNDVNILSVKEINDKKSEMWCLPCDIKEYTEYSDSFEDFIAGKVIPKINIYNIIIGTYLTIRDIRPAIESIKNQGKRLTIWIVSGKDPVGIDFTTGIVTMIHPSNNILQKEIDLNNDIERIDDGKPVLIFHNLLRPKLV